MHIHSPLLSPATLPCLCLFSESQAPSSLQFPFPLLPFESKHRNSLILPSSQNFFTPFPPKVDPLP